jgi:hypothetical protein
MSRDFFGGTFTCAKDRFALAEGWQLDEVVVGNSFEGVSGFAPGTEASGDDEYFEPELLELLRHTGAGGFALSSTVEINLLILGEVLDFFDEIVGFDTNRTGDAFGVGIVIAVAADVGDQHVASRIGGKSASEFLRRHAGNHVEQAVFSVDPDAIDGVGDESDAEDDFGGKASGAQAAGDGAERIAEEISRDGVGADIQNGAHGIILQKIPEAHFHASSQRRRHGVDAGDELGEEQGLFAAAVEIFRRAQNAGFRIRGKTAEKAEQRPSADSACEVEDDIASDHRHGADADHEIEVQVSVGGDCAGGEDGERSGQREADGFSEADYRQKQVAVVRNQ